MAKNPYVVATKFVNGTDEVLEYNVFPMGPAAFQKGQAYGGKVAYTDLRNIKSAITQVVNGGTVVLNSHMLGSKQQQPFNLGDGNDPSNTICITRNVTIKGAKNKPTIKGGRVVFRVGQTLPEKGAPVVPVSVTITNIKFEEFCRAAIMVFATKDVNEISDCDFTSYYRGDKDVLAPGDIWGAWPILTPLTVSPTDVRGTLRITGNVFNPDADGPLDGIVNNLIHVQNCNLTLDFSNNTIKDMHVAGIAVWGNQGETRVIGNTITKNSSFTLPGAGISVGLPNKLDQMFVDGSIFIEDNEVTVGAKESFGIIVFRRANSATVSVRGNRVTMVGGDGSDQYDRAALACFGGCSDSQWVENYVFGKARYGIYVSDQMPGRIDLPPGEELNPTGNEFKGNHLEGFVATKAQVFIGERAKGTQLRMNWFGSVSGENPEPEITPASPMTIQKNKPLWDDPITGVRCKGESGFMELNHFEKSAIPGWNKFPWVGCIFLDPQSNSNVVKWFAIEFPDNTVPPVTNQIYNGRMMFKYGTGNSIEPNTAPWFVMLWYQLKLWLRPILGQPIPPPPPAVGKNKAA